MKHLFRLIVIAWLAAVSGRAQEVVAYSTLTDLLAVDPRLIGRVDGGGTLRARVEVSGRTTASDGGGGLFDLVLASSGTTNRALFFRSTANATYAWSRVLNGQRITPQMAGARGDGSAQDYEALQSAVSYITTNRLSLHIPAGTYILTNKLVIRTNTSGWSITGDGAGSILKQTASSGNGTPIFEFQGGSITEFKITDLAFEWSPVGGVPASGFRNVGCLFAWDGGAENRGFGVYNFSLERLAFTFGFRVASNFDLSATSSSGVNVWGMALKSCRPGYMAGGAVLLSNAGSGGSPNVTVSDFHINGTTYGQPVATNSYAYTDPQFFCDSATSWSFHGVELNNVATLVPIFQFTGPGAQIVFDNCRAEAIHLATNQPMMSFDNVGVTIGSFEISNLNVATNIAGTLIKFDNSNTNLAAHQLVINSLDHQGNPTYPTLNLQPGASLTLVDAAVGTYAFEGNLPPVIGATTYGRSGPMLKGSATWRYQPATVGTNYTPVVSSTTNAPNWFRLTCTSNTLAMQAITGAVAGNEYVFDLSSANQCHISWVSPAYQMADESRIIYPGDRQLIRVLYNGTNFVQAGNSPAWGAGNRLIPLAAQSGGIAGLEILTGIGATTPSTRWRVATDGTAETGSNAGSNLAFSRFADAGTNNGTPVTINRATGLTTLTSLNVSGAMTQNSVSVQTADDVFPNTVRTLTYTTTNITGTYGGRREYRDKITLTNNCQLTFSGTVAGDRGIIKLVPATTNITILLASPARSTTGQTVTITAAGSTNTALLAWEFLDGEVLVNNGSYYR